MRGIAIAMLVFALGVYGSFLGASGFAEQVDADPGPSLDTQRDNLEKRYSDDQNVSNIGGDPSFFGINIHSGGLIGELFQLFNAVEPMLQAAQVPDSLARGIGGMALVFGGGMMLIQWIRGFRAED